MLEFELLQIALGTRTCFSVVPSVTNWNDFYQFALKQSLVGVLFDGIDRLPKEQMPNKTLLMTWFVQTEFIKKNNLLLNLRSSEMIIKFANDGFRSCIIKGQANAYYYPNPYSRIPGDIDIWVEGGHEKIVQYIKHRAKIERVQFHHVDYKVFDDAEVEVHFTPILLFNNFTNNYLQRVFKQESSQCFENNVQLSDDEKICVLTLRANAMLQLTHMYRHLLCGGVGLRHVVYFYYLLNLIEEQSDKAVLKKQLKKDLCKCGLYRFSTAVMYVLHVVCGMDEKWMLCDKNAEEGKFLLNEIMLGGNLGLHDLRFKNNNKYRKNKIANFCYKTYMNFHLFTHYPSDCIWNIFYRLEQEVWRRFNKY